jgi:cation diffusion facilitator CzcD-associated flavoprotein CzcO
MGSIGYKVPNDLYGHPLISERAIDEPRPLKVIYIGAGVSGICAAIQFPKLLPTVELAIYEKNADVGGTWFENRYPGCACGMSILMTLLLNFDF